ncbi:MAG TPA: response regulator [Polyangiaceae bacterium]|nr:response regulator [Polyangiaceae bacterium]
MGERVPEVLVVDDDPEVARTIERALRGKARVTIESSGRAALSRFAQGEQFELVLCDVMMPEMTGTELYDKARALDPGVVGAWVFVTGGATPGERARVAASGARCLAKPFVLADLQALLRSKR